MACVGRGPDQQGAGPGDQKQHGRGPARADPTASLRILPAAGESGCDERNPASTNFGKRSTRPGWTSDELARIGAADNLQIASSRTTEDLALLRPPESPTTTCTNGVLPRTWRRMVASCAGACLTVLDSGKGTPLREAWGNEQAGAKVVHLAAARPLPRRGGSAPRSLPMIGCAR